ncbi:cobalamin (vitamin B12) biosynthesis CbiX protein [Stanieria cyanosphaera PCC 7437]|uniref:Cobalamin (Vitamin B12) biosynthesis CbiX protein n=1 Tax=Stanieria cyanosphaera (strain ATCC 29371 / PCC 7437) TaxID=111780 RepID=K9XZF0_STAC7|nr:sirohydrochlorin chelatase [Stanieria cyanosphaera]AFZ37037.1 cobalamin (vitamin B12) biosynthesis CbiX protein [Stanieria cyanosphaera PCC 7437]
MNTISWHRSYLLIAHGSRDHRQHLALTKLTDLLRQQLTTNAILDRGKYLGTNSVITRKQKIVILERQKLPLVDYACLEFSPLSLAESIVNFARRSQQLGYRQVMLLPLFLLPGIHVTVDLPTQVNQAQQILNGQISLNLCSYLGSYVKMFELLRHKFDGVDRYKFNSQARDGKILLAHGSRLQKGNQPCQILAERLQATVAYWSSSPNLAESVATLVEQGKQNLVILPYFLFPGKITDAIATQVEQLQQDFPGVNLILDQPLGATVELANLILEGAVQ